MALARAELHRPWPGLRVLQAIDRLQTEQEQAQQEFVCTWATHVRAASDTNRYSFNHATQTLLQRGFIERCYYSGETKRKHGGYRITAAGRDALAAGWSGKSGSLRAKARLATGLQLRAWTAMRACLKFSLAELEILCAKGDERGLRKQLSRYVWALVRSGHVAPVRAAKGKFLLVRNSGPDAPVHRPRRQEVFDPNDGSVHQVRTGGAP